MEDEIVSMERIGEAGLTQNNLTMDKLANKRMKLENLKQKIEKQKRVIEEQKLTKEALEREMEEQERASVDLAQALKLNDKMVAGVQTKVYEHIKQKVKARVDSAIASRNFEFVNNLVVGLEGQEK